MKHVAASANTSAAFALPASCASFASFAWSASSAFDGVTLAFGVFCFHIQFIYFAIYK
jgi:hypothetical protein